jgi:hypothetical protein
MTIMETLTHALPFFRNRLDTKDPEYLSAKLIVLAVGVLVYGMLTWLAYRRAVRAFEKLDL